MTDAPQIYFNLKKSRFAPALWLDNFFPKKFRRASAKLFDAAIVLALVAVFIVVVGKFSQWPALREKLIDLVFMILSFRLIIFSLESFYRSKSESDFSEISSANIADYLDFEAASLLSKSRRKFLSGANIFAIFSKTEIGKFAFMHLGVLPGDFRATLARVLEKTPHQDDFTLMKVVFDRMAAQNKTEIGISEIILTIFETDEKISRLFFDLKVKKEDIAGVLEWATAVFKKMERKSRWWLEENLVRIQGIGKDWAYAATYLLDRYAGPFSQSSSVSSGYKSLHLVGHQKQIEAVEATLSRLAQANVLIVGEPGVGKRTVVAGFGEMIKSGRIRPELEYKRLLELDAGSLVSSAKTKGDLEELIIRLFNDAVKAGNIVLVIDNFAEFLKSVESLGVSLMQVIAPYLAGSHLQVIAISDSGGFKRFLEPNSSLMQYFEIIRIDEPDSQELFEILKDVSLEIEEGQGVMVLFQTIREIVNAATVYLTEGALPERAIDILETISAQAAGQGSGIMMPEGVAEFVSVKTKMPLGILRPEEKEKLLRLEEILHQRVVDQEEAISAISAAVRRVRTGLQETKKPLGSFLFLGPTGVGKTETAKALAEIYFGNEDAMIRFDMSEYQNENGLERLIGSFEKNEPGLLASKLREKPYGLLLLDEFEKCHPKVMDLFLQILDEGFFTDAFGKKVFTRNNIIIATSNAASQLIWEMGKKGIEPATLKEAVIDSIQKAGVFKAELLNRFDTIVIFRHLNKENLKAIARLMLEKLRKRLFRQKEIDLAINDTLLEKIAEIGYDPVFGARPMQRAIQERVEKKIAEWIIQGKIDRGSKIEFTVEDLEKV
ncbi:MAG: ATP-dependent Clp protease ATP-binding subunit [bacterium]|nr:ATP-dependent Clp protease ATP-binding subunit [bacterium]